MQKSELPLNDIGGINTYVNPLSQPDGNVIHCLNLDSNPLGGKKKRQGYSTFLNNPTSDTVNSLFSWTKNDGTTLWVYMASGTSVYSSQQGTGNWTACSNGGITSGAAVTYAMLDDNMIIGDANGTMKYTTDGTTFTDIGAAPVGGHHPVEYQGRIYTLGTASDVFYSTVGTIDDWVSDSSSFLVGGSGKAIAQFKASDRLVINKNSGAMFRWDGDSLVDMATELGPSSPYSIGNVEDFRFYLNRLGIFTTNGEKPQLISNAVQRQIYNDAGNGISGSVFDTAPADVYKYDYYLSIGDVTDDLSGITISNAILKYNYQKNEFVNYKFNNFPTAWHSYRDVNGVEQFIFGDASGQVYTYGNSVYADNSVAIESSIQFVVHANMPFIDKEWGYIEVMTNPGCQAKIAIAVENTFVTGEKKWKEIGSLKSGFNQFRFPSGSRGRLLFINIYEASADTPFELYGINFTYNPILR